MSRQEGEKPAKPASQAERRELRRAEALRANLKRRKAGPKAAPPKPGSDGE